MSTPAGKIVLCLPSEGNLGRLGHTTSAACPSLWPVCSRVAEAHAPASGLCWDHSRNHLIGSLASASPTLKILSTAMLFASSLRCSWHVRCTHMTSSGLQECQKCRHNQINSSPRQPTSSTWRFSMARSLANISTCDTCEFAKALNSRHASRAAIKVQVGPVAPTELSKNLLSSNR